MTQILENCSRHRTTRKLSLSPSCAPLPSPPSLYPEAIWGRGWRPRAGQRGSRPAAEQRACIANLNCTWRKKVQKGAKNNYCLMRKIAWRFFWCIELDGNRWRFFCCSKKLTRCRRANFTLDISKNFPKFFMWRINLKIFKFISGEPMNDCFQKCILFKHSESQKGVWMYLYNGFIFSSTERYGGVWSFLWLWLVFLGRLNAIWYKRTLYLNALINSS